MASSAPFVLPLQVLSLHRPCGAASDFCCVAKGWTVTRIKISSGVAKRKTQKGKDMLNRVQVGCAKWVWSYAGWLWQEEPPCNYNISLRLTPHIELSSLREKTHRNSFFYLMGHGGIEE